MRVLEIILTFTSIGFFIAGIVYFFSKAKERRFTKRLVFLTVYTLIAIILLQLCNILINENNGISTLLIDVMQVFSLDFDYASAICLEGLLNTGLMGTINKVYRIIIYTVAPIIGGALLYDVLAGISPDLKLLSAGRRKFYIFSQLNEKSLTLAESIVSKPEIMKNPLIIFVDCNTDSESESYQEMLVKANSLKAICLPEGLLNYPVFSRSERCSFFLLNSLENGEFDDTVNLTGFKGLLSEEDFSFIKNKGAGIFFFTNEATAVENVRVIKNDYDNSHENTDKISLHVIRDNAQTANNLMKVCPPYETLTLNGNDPLEILILGNNGLSREFFRTVFWCCQILNHKLRIVVAGNTDENGRTFKSWLNSVSREVIESCTVNAECLKISAEGAYSEPYAALGFIDADLENLDVEGFLNEERSYDYGCGEKYSLKQFNYFIVACGNDEGNVYMAEQIRKNLSYLNFNESEARQKDIVTIVEDNELSEILALRYRQWNNSHTDIKMQAYGSIRERFSVETVYSYRSYLVDESGNTNGSVVDHFLPKFDSTKDDIYNEWSNIARSYHLDYKMFSAGYPLYQPGNETPSGDFLLNQKLDYVKAVSSDAELFYDLAWLEHRRWTAFIRLQGFRQTPDLITTFDKLAECMKENNTTDAERLLPKVRNQISLHNSYGYKDIPNLYHPCLVECLMNGDPDSMDYLDLQSKMRELIDLEAKKEKKPSAKKAITRKHRHVHTMPGGIKNYDCPDGDNYPLMTPEETYEYLLGKKPTGKQLPWNEVLKAYPEIGQCAHKLENDRFYTDMVMDYKAEHK